MDYKTKLLIGIEGFLKNASSIDGPFMLKGSVVTRQFFPNPNMRFVQDLDWVYLEQVDNVALAGSIFSEWVIKITENNVDEHAWFKNFRDNNFWRMIDYAMDDDFPTTNTDLSCIVDKEEFEIGLDISFNLDIDFPPEELIYRPLNGEPFKLKNICPYALQVSWKLHQLLVRPRLKDIFDLIYLLNHERFNHEELEKIIFALKKECKRDGVDVKELIKYIEDPIVVKKEKPKFSLFNFGRRKPEEDMIDLDTYTERDYGHFTTTEYFPFKNNTVICAKLQETLNKCGFTKEILS